MALLSRVFNANTFRQYALMLIGCLIGAASYPLFLEPNHIAPGGLTGVTMILNYYFAVPIGLGSLVLNIPLIILGWRLIGARFILRTVLATVLFSVLIDLMNFEPLSLDPMLAAVFGGVMLGFGLALIIRGNATTGGTDLLARIVHHRQRAISIGSFLFAFDLAVILLAWLFMSVQHALYAIVCVFVSAKVLDQALLGIGTDKACYVISREPDRIAKRVMDELERGVTVLNASGAYSGREFKMLLSIVGRLETVKIKQIVQEEDPQAFMFITDTHETLGEGFRKLTGEEI
ncbi:MAG: YitT family protein [Clostridiales bacterium]|nr:YitT family protein [Clostridiales bacterium]